MTSKQLCQATDWIYHHRILEPRLAAVYDDNPLDLAVFPCSKTREPPRVSVLLSAGLMPPPEVKGLPWGIVDMATDKLIAVGRTDAFGRFELALRDGQYRVRYVPKAQLPLDHDILERLQIEDHEELRAQGSQPFVRVVSRSMVFGTVSLAATRVMVFDDDSSMMSSSDDAGTDDLSPSVNGVRLSPDGKSLVIRCPIENQEQFTFPFAVAAVELLSDDRAVLGLQLMAVARNENLSIFQGRLDITDLVPADGAQVRIDRLRVYEIAEESEDLLGRIDESDVQRLLADPFVYLKPELQTAISRLQQRLRETRTKHDERP